MTKTNINIDKGLTTEEVESRIKKAFIIMIQLLILRHIKK